VIEGGSMSYRVGLPQPETDVATTATQRAEKYIRRLIVEGVLKPGTRVPQEDVAKILAMSRNPIREALISLHNGGWVTLEPHRGAFVNAVDARTVRDHFELCGFIHGLALRRALQGDDGSLLRALAAIAQQFSATESVTVAGQLSYKFHTLVISGAQSPRILAAHRAVSAIVPGNIFEQLPECVSVEREGLLAIVAAATADDLDVAACAYANMMRGLGHGVLALFAARGLISGSAATDAP
jgi:DNA-binding GntR family transcriptional regulator